MSGVCLNVKVGAAGKGGNRVHYDTRLVATRGEHERVWTQNVPEYADRGEAVSYKERRADLVEFFRQLDEDELQKDGGRGGEDGRRGRTFYRLIYSFHEDPGDERVREMVAEHQREALPRAYIVNAIHRNSGHVHVHSVVAARQRDGTKLHLGWREYRTLDEKWARVYGREFGARFEREHLEKKEERREHRRRALEAKERGEEPPPRPQRVTHSRNQLEERIKIAQRENGVIRHDDERGTTGSKRRAAARAGAGAGGSRTREASPGSEGVEGRGREAPGGVGGERAPEKSTPGRAGHAERDQHQLSKTLPGEGRAAARKDKRQGAGDGRGVRTLEGVGGTTEERGGSARRHDPGVTGQVGNAAGSAQAAGRMDVRGPGESAGRREAAQPPGADHQRAGFPDRASRPGDARSSEAEPGILGRGARGAERADGVPGGPHLRGGAVHDVSVRSQLDTKLAGALTEFSRVLAEEKERAEQYREADRASAATQAREGSLTPGTPPRDGPGLGRSTPDTNVTGRDAPKRDTGSSRGR